tara:strand:- start:3113 stop:4801 length:1689 start_codon:yes stop_codon:yes gene_type:complete
MVIKFIEIFLKYTAFYIYFYLVGKSFFVVVSYMMKEKFQNHKFLYLRIELLYPLMGMILVSNFLFIIHTFFNLESFIINFAIFLFLVPSLLDILKNKKFRNINGTDTINSIFYYLIIPSILLVSTFDINFNYDAGYYHLLHQSWLRESNLIIGMVNIFWAFGMSSIYEYISAFLWFDTTFVLLHFLNLFFIHFLYIFISENLIKQKNKHLFNVSIFLLIYSLLDNFGIGGGRNGFIYIQGVTKQDVTVGILFFFLSIVILLKINDKSATKFELFLISFISLFVYQLKVSAVLILLIYLLLLVFEYNEKKLNFKDIFKINIPVIFLSSFWLFKSLLTTGCLIFPVAFTCFDSFNWYLKGSTEVYESITKSASLAFDNSVPLIEWIKASGFFEYRNQIFLNFFASLLILLVIRFFLFEKEKMPKKIIFIAAGFLIANFLYLLFFGPIPRYAIGATLTTAGVVGVLTSNFKFKIPQFLIYFSIFLSVVFLVRADSYLGFLNNNEFRFFDPRTNNKINIEIGFEKINENWVRPLDQDQCWSNTKCTLTKYEIELLKDRTFKIAYAK